MASSFNNLAKLYESQGRYVEAEPLYVRCLVILVNRLGEAHPHTQTVWRNFRYFVQQVMQAGQTAQLSDHLLARRAIEQLTQEGNANA